MSWLRYLSDDSLKKLSRALLRAPRATRSLRFAVDLELLLREAERTMGPGWTVWLGT